MSKRAEGSRGDGPLLTFSRNLGDVIGGLPEDFQREVVPREVVQELDGAESKLKVFGIELDMTEEVVATIKALYIRQLVSELVRKDLMGGKDHIRSSERSFEKPGTVRALEFASGTGERPLDYHGEVWSPDTSCILGAQILHRFSVNSQTSGESVFRCAVVEMPETRCEFRSEPGSMGDNTEVAFVSRASGGRRVWVRGTRLLGISKGAGRVAWTQRLTLPKFEEELINAVSRTIAQG